MIHEILVLVPVVELLTDGAVDVVIPVADKELLIEERPIGAEEREPLTSEVRVCAHPEHLAPGVQISIIA